MLLNSPVTFSHRPHPFVRSVDKTKAMLQGYAHKLLAGRMTKRGFVKKIADAIHDLHERAASAGMGYKRLGPEHHDALDKTIAFNLRALQGFFDALTSGEQPVDGTVVNRAGMYAEAAYGTYEEFQRTKQEDSGLSFERRLLDSDPTVKHCDDCIDAAALSWQPIGTLPRIGESQCMVRCRCRFEYSGKVSPGGRGTKYVEVEA